jgi:hypothetical protein
MVSLFGAVNEQVDKLNSSSKIPPFSLHFMGVPAIDSGSLYKSVGKSIVIDPFSGT